MSETKNSLLKLYKEIEFHLLEDTKPSNYLQEIYVNPLFLQYPFDMLHKLKNTMQSPKYHPEGNVWNHTLLVVDEAAKVKQKSKNPTVFMWAAILHDIGKECTTKSRKGKITSYNHDKVGAMLAQKFLSQFVDDNDFIDEVCGLIRYHMQILFVVKGAQFADIKEMLHNTDVNEAALLGLCDRLGRLNSNKKEEENNIKLFLQACGTFSGN